MSSEIEDIEDTLRLLGFRRRRVGRWEVPLDPEDDYAQYEDVTGNGNIFHLNKYLLVALFRLPKEELPFMVSHGLVPPGIRIVLLRMLERHSGEAT